VIFLSFAAVPVNQGFFLYGLQLSTAAHAALLYTLTPLFVLLLAQAVLGEFAGWRTAAGTALALGGTLYVLLHRGIDLSRGPLVGDLLLLIAVIAWAVYTAEGRELVAEHGALPTIAWTLIGGTLLYLPLGLGSLLSPTIRADIAHASPEAWWGIAYLIVITSVVAYLLWYWALRHLAAARVAIFTNLQPLATAFLAHVFLGERVTAQFLAGAVVVIAGVLLAQWKAATPTEEALIEAPAKS
jgi:drug/metabolite transporter (DMT)-like permease